jgi:hypothetical protein
MFGKSLICVIVAACCLTVCGQDRPIRIETEAIFANFGDFNPQNNCLLYVGVNTDGLKSEMIKSSVRIKFLTTNRELIVQENTLVPAIGWLDSSHILLEATTSAGKQTLFGDWQTHLIRYDIFTSQSDTLPSLWYTSTNSVGNLLSSDNKFFYTIAYDKEGMETVYWMEYSIETAKNRIIKSYNNHSFSIHTYQYLQGADEIIYIKGEGDKKNVVRLSIATGQEKVIKALCFKTVEESSAIVGEKLYFIVTEISKSQDSPARKAEITYTLKSIDLNTNLIADVYISKKEIYKVSPYKKGMILLSIHGDAPLGEVTKSFDLIDGGTVKVAVDASSYLYELRIDHN